MVSSQIVADHPIGSFPSISYTPYLIFCSYLVSLIGAFTTVELLHRRVAGAGWRSWIQVGGCAVSFGLVAIWCMHFVANKSIVLGDGEKEIQLYYSPTYTAVSAILPVVVIFVGLLVADRFYKNSKRAVVRFASLGVCGVCTGAAVTEMHYLGNNGTTNYRLKLDPPYVVGAATIAIGACLFSFGLFFHWGKLWMNNIWRRTIVACILAAAVSGMHWTAAAGTKYEIRGYHDGQSTNVNLIISLCLCLGACVVCFLLGFLKQRQRRMLKDRAKQVVLACATFDSDGRLLVSQSGLMPCQTITNQFHQRTFDDEFNTSHPVFQWTFRVSRNWAGIHDLIPSMRDHLQSIGYLQANSSTHASGSRTSLGIEDDSSYSATFRQLFCVTAQDIARTMGTSIQSLGCLYDEVLTTGSLANRLMWTSDTGGKPILAADIAISPKDIENGLVNPILFGKGQMLVLTKTVDSEEADRLQNMGYGFANIEQVGDQLARSLQIPKGELEDLVNRLQAFSKRTHDVPANGTYVASFLIQPLPAMKGLDIVVPRTTPDRLPMVKLTSEALTNQQMAAIRVFNGLSLDDCLKRLEQRSVSQSADDIFLGKFHDVLLELVHDVCPEQELHRAIFSAQQLNMVHGMTGKKGESNATIFGLCGIKEIYIQSLQSPALKTIPLSLFQTYLRSYPGCSDHAILAQQNHREFDSLQHVTSITKPPPLKLNGRWPTRFWHQRSMSKGSVDMSWRADSCSEKGLVPVETGNHAWGSIMVTSTRDIVIDDSKSGSRVELQELGVRTEVGLTETEQQTLADRLMSITTAFRDPHSTRTLPNIPGRKYSR